MYLESKVECPSCHNLITEDKIIDAYRTSKSADDALDNSIWLVGYVKSLLIESGYNEMITGRYVDGDEIDLIVSCLNVDILIECQDKSIDLGDAYKFSGKLTTTGVDFGILVSTDRISEEAINFLMRGSKRRGERSNINAVTGDLDKIKTEIQNILKNTLVIQIRGIFESERMYYPSRYITRMRY
jgi:hypothetical protein